MLKNFQPNFTINSEITKDLLRIESAKEQVKHLPLNPIILSSLRETAKLYTTHYSTMIEGNELEPHEIKEVIDLKGHFPGKERDEEEVKGYYAALAQMEQYSASNEKISEIMIKTLHALVMSNGKSNVKPTEYRDGQNVIKDSSTGAIIYMPPEAKDVPNLMKKMIEWINSIDIPAPLIAAIAHYQFATIHPYYDGNGRTGRLLASLILHMKGYGLKGLYSLEEYYAKNLPAYYRAISIGPSHNYYFGREEADITSWLEYFTKGMAFSFEKVVKQMSEQENREDHSNIIKSLDPRQRKALTLFQEYDEITSSQMGEIFGFKQRTSSALCKKWVEDGFLDITNHSLKGRKYKLGSKYKSLV